MEFEQTQKPETFPRPFNNEILVAYEDGLDKFKIEGTVYKQIFDKGGNAVTDNKYDAIEILHADDDSSEKYTQLIIGRKGPESFILNWDDDEGKFLPSEESFQNISVNTEHGGIIIGQSGPNFNFVDAKTGKRVGEPFNFEESKSLSQDKVKDVDLTPIQLISLRKEDYTT